MAGFEGFVAGRTRGGERGRGRPPEDNRNIINGICGVCAAARPWRDVPEKYGNWNSIYRRFRRWSASGVWESVAITLAETMAESGHYNIDSTSVRAHVSAAGGKGGFIEELLAARGAGSPVKFIVSAMDEAAHRVPPHAGEAADCKAYDDLIDLPEQKPKALLADKAYDTDAIRADLKRRGIKAVIPPKSNRKVMIRYNKRLYRERNCIERVFGHLKINRAIATRYDQLAESFLGMLYLASARYWLKFVHAA